MSKNKEIKLDSLKKEFLTLQPKFKNFCEELSRQISIIIESEKIRLAVPIQHRPKTLESLIDKHVQRRFTIKKSILEVQDLVGIRIILLFQRDAEKIAQIIRENFDIISEYNPGEKLEDNQFGYSSLHQVTKLRNEWLKTPTLKDFKDISAEIQIRTLAQHAWAETSNILQYKKEDSVPKPLKRTIGRISAVLELIDLEFERALSDRETYKHQIQHTDFSNNLIEELNVDLLEQILNKKFARENDIEHGEEYSEFLEELKILGIRDTQNLNDLINNNLEYVLKLEKRICKEMIENYRDKKILLSKDNYAGDVENLNEIKSGIFFTAFGLIREMLNHKFGEPWHKVLRRLKNSNKTSISN